MGIFTQAQERGWIGKQPLDSYIDHSLSFAKAARTIPSLAVDVGTGAGIPGLVLAAFWPECRWILAESSLARASFLELHCGRMGWFNRVEIYHGDANSLRVDNRIAGEADLVTARGFGAVEGLVGVAAFVLRSGGELIVSAAPQGDVWNESFLNSYGFAGDEMILSSPRFHRVRKL